MSRDEVFQHRETLPEIRGNRPLNDFSGGLGHEAPHPGELLNLVLITPRTGIYHHEEWVSHLTPLVEFQLPEEDIRNVVRRPGPDINDLLVAFAVSNNTVPIVLGDLFDLRVSLLDLRFFFLGDHHIHNPD